MRYGFVFPGGDVHAAVACAVAAEQAGWDGFFVWDAAWGVDPWVTLAACAVRTERIRLGTMLTPVSRRRPWKLASETATLDRLSGGRVILAVGLGAPDSGFDAFGEVTDRRTRAALLDEGLDIVTGLWRGQPFSYVGTHYRVQPMTRIVCPPPVQQPRIPIWVVGAWPSERSMGRVVRYDGLLPTLIKDGSATAQPSPDDLRAMREYIQQRRTEQTPFDIVLEGEIPDNDPARIAAAIGPYAEAGATWWLESMWSAPDLSSEAGQAPVLARVRRGPPRLDS